MSQGTDWGWSGRRFYNPVSGITLQTLIRDVPQRFSGIPSQEGSSISDFYSTLGQRLSVLRTKDDSQILLVLLHLFKQL